jgi:hypothetical protein
MPEPVKINQTTAQVPIKSAWLSKVNWVQVVAFLAMVLSYFGLPLDATQQAAIVVVIGVLSQIVTIILRTWFNGSVTEGSLTKT